MKPHPELGIGIVTQLPGKLGAGFTVTFPKVVPFGLQLAPVAPIGDLLLGSGGPDGLLIETPCIFTQGYI
jgi:hypothetical protein